MFLDFMSSRLPAFRKFAQDFLQQPGAAVPAVMSLDGQALGGPEPPRPPLPELAELAAMVQLVNRSSPLTSQIATNPEPPLPPLPQGKSLACPGR